MLKRIALSSIALAFVSGCATTSPEPEVSGVGMDKEQIRRAIREHLVPIRHCYEKELKVSPKIEGKLVLEWDIGDLGKVTSISVRKPMHPLVDKCVADVIKSTQFPAPPSGQVGRVIFPFVFSSNPEKSIK